MEVFLYFLLEIYKFNLLIFVAKPVVDLHRSTCGDFVFWVLPIKQVFITNGFHIISDKCFAFYLTNSWEVSRNSVNSRGIDWFLEVTRKSSRMSEMVFFKETRTGLSPVCIILEPGERKWMCSDPSFEHVHKMIEAWPIRVSEKCTWQYSKMEDQI